jgi:hypothetical protein
MKKEASHFTNKKCTPKNARGSKTSYEKEASHFMNKKHTAKNARGSKTSDGKRGIAFHEQKCTPKSARGSKTSDEARPRYTIQKLTLEKYKALTATQQNKSLEGNTMKQITRR